MVDAIIFGFGFFLGGLACYLVVLFAVLGLKSFLEGLERREIQRDRQKRTDWENSPEGKRQRAAEYDTR